MRAARTGVVPVVLLTVVFGLGAAATPLGNAGAAASSSAVHRNTTACQYIYWTYSGLFERPGKGYRPSALPEKVAGAASATLRRELAFWKAASAYENGAGVLQVGTAMVNTCDRLGFSHLD